MYPNPNQHEDGVESDRFPPTAFLIGAQKAGTTYLANLLLQTSCITLPASKEPHFFTLNWERGLAWYRQQFPLPHRQILMDASTSYSAAPIHLGLDAASDPMNGRRAGVPERIYSVSPAARFIYLLRDPVERAWSSYWHDVRYTKLKSSFDAALKQDPRYTNISDYLSQIRLYQRTFSSDRFLFLRFEDLQRDPDRVVSQCLRFLELPENNHILTINTGKHPGYQPGRLAEWTIHAARQRPMVNLLQNRIWATMPSAVQHRLRRMLTKPVPRMKEFQRARLAERFAPAVGDLEVLTGLNLSVWRSMT